VKILKGQQPQAHGSGCLVEASYEEQRAEHGESALLHWKWNNNYNVITIETERMKKRGRKRKVSMDGMLT
jgi:hypothetical protein